jgi:hypothetical protein
MQVELSRDTLVNHWIYLVLNIDCGQFLDTCLGQVGVELPVSSL